MAKGFKTGGREKGTLNKTTVELKKLLKEFILDEFKELKPRIEELDTNQRLQILTMSPKNRFVDLYIIIDFKNSNLQKKLI